MKIILKINFVRKSLHSQYLLNLGLVVILGPMLLSCSTNLKTKVAGNLNQLSQHQTVAILPVEIMEKPYRMLLLWEETMAQTVAEFLKNLDNLDSKLVVLAGGFHVQYGFGIPKRAFRRVPHAYSIILPTITEIPPELENREMDVKHVSIPLYAGDYAWKLQYKVLPENKIKLGVILENRNHAVLIKSVAKNSNAERAGLKNGDLLLRIDEIKLKDIEDLISRLQKKNIGDRARLLIKRKLKEMNIEIQFLETTP